MSHHIQPIGGSLHLPDDKVGPELSDEAAREDPFPIMWGRSSDKVPDRTPSVLAWTWKVTTVVGRPVATDGVQGLISEDGRFSGMPS